MRRDDPAQSSFPRSLDKNNDGSKDRNHFWMEGKDLEKSFFGKTAAMSKIEWSAWITQVIVLGILLICSLFILKTRPECNIYPPISVITPHLTAETGCTGGFSSLIHIKTMQRWPRDGTGSVVILCDNQGHFAHAAFFVLFKGWERKSLGG